jgi:hypothetical protein
MAENEQNRRKFKRIEFHAPARLTAGDGSWDTDVLDISLKGVLLEEPAGWPGLTDGGTAGIALPLDDDQEIQMTATLAHREGGRLGFSWTDISVDDLTRLRRLLELNLGDADLIAREISSLGS